MVDNRRLRYALDQAHGVPAKRPKTLRCVWCKTKIKVKPQGRLPLFCSHSCRQRAYERAKWGQPHLVAVRRDLATVEVRRAIREEAWALLREAGLAPTPKPPPMLRRNRPQLRVVSPESDNG
jgi:hypothetical protein